MYNECLHLPSINYFRFDLTVKKTPRQWCYRRAPLERVYYTISTLLENYAILKKRRVSSARRAPLERVYYTISTLLENYAILKKRRVSGAIGEHR